MKHKLPIIVLAAAACCGLSLSALYTGNTGFLSGDTRQSRVESPPKTATASLPFFEDFSDENSLDAWSQVNNSPYSWTRKTNDGAKVQLAQTFEFKADCDNWLISPAFSLKHGMTYRLSFDVKNWRYADMHVYLVKSNVNPENGATLLYDYIGDEWGVKNIEFEVPETGTYYIGFYDKTPWNPYDQALLYQLYLDNIRLEVLSNNSVPEAPGDLVQVPGKNGEISMGLKWTNPLYSKLREELDVLSDVKIYKDGNLVSTIETGIEPGQEMTWVDDAPTEGEHTYSVVVSNTTGEGDAATVNTFIGVDLPGAPENLNVDYDAEGGIITLDWEQPQFGKRGGWYDPAGISYRVVRQPGHKILASGLKDEMFEDTELTDYGNYVYQVTTLTDAGEGGTSASAPVLVGQTLPLPLIEGWEDATTLPTWTIVDNNKDGSTLTVSSSQGYESPHAIGLNVSSVLTVWDESLFSPPVRLEKGKKYRTSFVVISNPYQQWSMNLTYGKDKTQEEQKTSVLSLTDASAPDFASEEREFTAKETGTFYFCWRIYDATGYAWFDDFRIEEVLDKNVEATSVKNLNSAPSPGDLLTTGVTYTNRGAKKTSAFKVQLLDDSNNVLGEQTISRPVNAGATGTVNIKWTVPQTFGKYNIRGRVIMVGDQCERDNTTPPVVLNVQKKGTRAVVIGTSQDVSGGVPFKSFGQIYSQSIYRGEDFGNIAGIIKSLAFRVRFGMSQDFAEIPFRLYIGNTDQEDLRAGWIPVSKLEKVFEGKLDLNRGAYDFEIPFDTPFEYTGGNICVLLASDQEYSLMLNNGDGMGACVSEYGMFSSRSVSDTFELDGKEPPQDDGSYFSYVPNVIFYIDHSKTGSISGTVADADGNPLEGIEVSGSGNLKAVTDKEGKYMIPYHPAGFTSLKATMKGYQDGSNYGTVKSGEVATVDFAMMPLEKLKFKGYVNNAADGSPIAGATLHLAGDNEFTTSTGEDGAFEIDGAFAEKTYPVFTIEAEGFSPVVYNSIRLRGNADSPYEMNIKMNPVTASPYSVTALDKGDKALISWTAPIENVLATKSGDAVSGQFGGTYDMLVGHRYTAEEIKDLGVDGEYHVQSVSFVPACRSAFKVTIWQGDKGNETMVYQETVNPEKIGEWNEFTLSRPYKVDPSKSLIVGYAVNAISGAFPVGLDNGPVVDGGDCLFDPEMNTWTTAHEVLPGSMNYNWSIRTTFGNFANGAPIPWFSYDDFEDYEDYEAPLRAVRLGDPVTLEESLNSKPEDNGESSLTGLGTIMFENPIAYAPIASLPVRTKIEGYNVYRFEAGYENEPYEWEKLNSAPITEMNYTDETWGDLEDIPYRFAVKSYYGGSTKYSDGVTSAATFSDGVDKGRYATVAINVITDQGSPEGAVVNLIGDGKNLRKTVDAGKTSVEFEDVRFADYTLIVTKPFFNHCSSNVSVVEKDQAVDVNLAFAALSPSDLDAKDYIHEARLAWSAPTSEVSVDLFTGNQIPGNGFTRSVGRENIVGQRSTPESRVNYTYDDFYFDALKFYANAAVTYSPLIWEQTVFGQVTQIARLDYTVNDYEVGNWITVKLDEPIKVNPESTYFFGYAATAESESQRPFMLDNSGISQNGCWTYGYSLMNRRYEWMENRAEGSWMVAAHITDIPNPEEVEKANVKFNLYRFAAADADDESKWTSVNSQPIAEEQYVDKTWQPLEEKDWQYAVKSVFDGGAVSKASLSKILQKGKVALVNVDLTTDNGKSAQGARMSLICDGKMAHSAESDANGHIEIPEVRKEGKYELKITLSGFKNIEEPLLMSKDEINLVYELKEDRVSPGFVEVFPAADKSSVEVNWRKPGEYAPREGWVYWDNGKPYGGFGSSTGFCAVAQLFDPKDQEDKGMRELDITSISFYPTLTADNPVGKDAKWVAKIWRVNDDMTVSEVATGSASGVALNEWNEVEFDVPYHVSGEETLLVGYEFTGSGSALGIDAGPTVPGKGDWVNFGQGWNSLSAVEQSFKYNNLIHTHCENLYVKTGEKAPALSEPQPIVKGVKPDGFGITRVKSAGASAADHPLLVKADYDVKGYLVYRLPSSERANEAAWTLLTPDAVADTKFTDKGWKDAGKGLCTWAVKAVYATGNSDAALCSYSVDENGNLSQVDGIAAEDLRISQISRGKFLVVVPEDGDMSVADVAGVNLLQTGLSAGDNVICVDAAEGVYVFRVSYGGKVRSFKYVIK